MASNPFASVTLKKVQTKEPVQKEPLVQLCENEDQYRQLMLETYLEEYYEPIKPYTFASSFISLSKETTESFIKYHKDWKNRKNADSLFTDWKQDTHLQNLSKSIDEKKTELKSKFVFIRLSSRSPKDAALTKQNFKDLFLSELKTVEDAERALDPNHNLISTDENRRLHALYIASTIALRAANGDEAIQLLVESDRIQGDLEHFVENADKEQFNAVVREFVDFDVEFEFRAFVYNKKYTALTQYNNYIYFPKLVQKKNEIAEIVHNFMTKELIPKLQMSNYVIDLLVAPSRTGPELVTYVVEVNPFAEFAGSGLFTWEEDKALLLGKRDFEFRINTSVPPLAKNQIATDWQPFIYK